MRFISYCLSLSLYIMSSCLMRYSVLMNLILQIHAGQWSMCGVIVVDAGRSRSTLHRRDAYVHDHCLRCHHNFALFYQLLNSNLFTHRMFSFKREASSETYGPRVYFPSYIFRSINQKTQKYLTAIYLYLLQFTLLFNFYTYLYQMSLLFEIVKELITPFPC